MIYPLTKVMAKELTARGVTETDIDKVVDLTKAVFGTDWILPLLEKRKATPPFQQHPITIGIASGSFTHFMELLELCVYLLTFKNGKDIMRIITDLKELSSYDDALYPLAMAYRFKKLGLQVDLEPGILNGLRADFKAGHPLTTKSLMAECTLMREWNVRTEERNVFFEFANNLKSVHKEGGQRFTIDVITKQPLSFKMLGEMKADLTRIGNEFLKTFQPNTLSKDAYEVKVAVMDGATKAILDDLNGFQNYAQQDDWDQVLSFSIGHAAVPGDITSVDYNHLKSDSLIRYKSLVTPEEFFAYSFEDRVDNKVSGKVKQIRSHPPDSVPLLFLETEDKMEGADFEKIEKRLAGDMFKRVPKLGAIFISKRFFAPNLQHHYQGRLIHNPAIPFPKELWFSMNSIEPQIDFVKDLRQLY